MELTSVSNQYEHRGASLLGPAGRFQSGPVLPAGSGRTSEPRQRAPSESLRADQIKPCKLLQLFYSSLITSSDWNWTEMTLTSGKSLEMTCGKGFNPGLWNKFRINISLTRKLFHYKNILNLLK